MSKTLRVLYVEDIQEDFNTISLMLKRSQSIDFDIEWAKTPEEFCEKVTEGSYDAFIIDYRLGSVNGLDLIRNCEIAVDKPIIILTAYGSEDLDKESLEAGASFFVDKDSLSDDWKILDKILRYSSLQGKRVYNSVKSGMRLTSTEEVEKVSQIFDFDYLKHLKTA